MFVTAVRIHGGRAENLPVNHIGQRVPAIYLEAFAVPLRALSRTLGGE